MRYIAVFVAFSVLCGYSRADESDDQTRAAARAHYAKGTSYFDLGRYDEAVTEYELAYQSRNEPSLLYNIAQAHRLGNRPAVALRFYRMYLTKVPDAQNRGEVENKIATLERLVEQQKKAQNSPPDHALPPPVATSTKPVASEVVPTPPSTGSENTAHADAAIAGRPGRSKRIAGAVVAGAGLGIVVGGIVCGVLAKNASDAISSADRAHQPFDQGKYNTGKTDQLLEGVLLGVGGAALVTGGVLFAVGYREKSKAHMATVVPTLSPTHAGVEVRGSF